MKNTFYFLLKLFLVIVILINFAGCSVSISANELSSDYDKENIEVIEISEDFKESIADFSMSLFKGLVTKDDENDLVSPLSAILCLALIANGADSNTKIQFENVFNMDIDTLDRMLFSYISMLYSADDCKVKIANSIWLKNDENLKIKEDFLQTNANYFDAQVYSADFDKTTVKDINSWCDKHTDGMIDKIIEDIDDDTIMYLINALMFDAKWAKKYEKDDVIDYEFHNYDNTTSQVSMLSSNEYDYISFENVTGFLKNYAGNKYSILCLLPDENIDIYDYIDSLNGNNWYKIWNSRINENVSIKMPEFTYSTKMNLNDVLISLGLTDMFNENADFSKMGKYGDNKIYCSEVSQKTFIQVDRNGTKAAAITWGMMKSEACPNEYYVILDRPFIYSIVDNNTGLPLFIGVVSNLNN